MDNANTAPRPEMEEAFRNSFLTGPVHEDWAAWSRLFTDDATYDDHFWGTFRGPAEIQRFLEGTMSFAAHVYSPLMWYAIDRNRVVYQVVNRVDNPVSGRAPIDFPSLQVIEYAGDGRWAAETDWWTVAEMKLFNQRHRAALAEAGGQMVDPLSRADWGDWVDWARPSEGHVARPSWLGRDVQPIGSMADMDFGVRHERPDRAPRG